MKKFIPIIMLAVAVSASAFTYDWMLDAGTGLSSNPNGYEGDCAEVTFDADCYGIVMISCIPTGETCAKTGTLYIKPPASGVDMEIQINNEVYYLNNLVIDVWNEINWDFDFPPDGDIFHVWIKVSDLPYATGSVLIDEVASDSGGTFAESFEGGYTGIKSASLGAIKAVFK